MHIQLERKDESCRTIPLSSEEYNTMERRQVSWLVLHFTLRTFPFYSTDCVLRPIPLNKTVVYPYFIALTVADTASVLHRIPY